MKKYKSISLLFALFILAGCYSVTAQFLPHNNKGLYTVTIGKSEAKNLDDSVTIRGHVFDLKTGRPLKDALVIDGCFKFQTTSDGEYSFRTKNLEHKSFYLEVAAFPYLKLETDYIDLSNKKEVIIDIYLDTDHKSYADCTTGWSHDQMQKELNNLK